MARPKKQDARRADLVEAALAAGSKRGLRSLSLADVAEAAGLTRGAILYYYDDLDALLKEAHRAGVKRFCDMRDAAVEEISSPQEQLATAIRQGLPTGPDDALMRLLYEFDILAGTSTLHDELVMEMYERQLAIYTKVLSRGVQAGVFVPSIPVAQLAMNLVALEDAYGLHIVAGNRLVSVSVAESAIRAITDSLGCPTTI